MHERPLSAMHERPLSPEYDTIVRYLQPSCSSSPKQMMGKYILVLVVIVTILIGPSGRVPDCQSKGHIFESHRRFETWSLVIGVNASGSNIYYIYIQSHLVITLSSGGIFWGRPYKRGALWDPVDLFDIIIPRRSKGQAKLPRLEVELV